MLIGSGNRPNSPDVTEVAMFKALVGNSYNWNRSLDAGGAAGV